jgi:hypothetical protein
MGTAGLAWNPVHSTDILRLLNSALSGVRHLLSVDCCARQRNRTGGFQAASWVILKIWLLLRILLSCAPCKIMSQSTKHGNVMSATRDRIRTIFNHTYIPYYAFVFQSVYRCDRESHKEVSILVAFQMFMKNWQHMTLRCWWEMFPCTEVWWSFSTVHQSNTIFRILFCRLHS